VEARRGRGGGGGGRRWGGCPDAAEAVALATALAESALESEREKHTAGPGENTLARLCDFNDPQLYGLNGQACLGDGWQLGRLRPRQRQLGSYRVSVPGPAMSGDIPHPRSVFCPGEKTNCREMICLFSRGCE
jgi:hypothetical protein